MLIDGCFLYSYYIITIKRGRETSSTTPPQPAAISSFEYGYRRTTAWDLKAYAELCDADIGDIFVKVANVPSKDRDKNYEMMEEEDRKLFDQLKKSLADNRF